MSNTPLHVELEHALKNATSAVYEQYLKRSSMGNPSVEKYLILNNILEKCVIADKAIYWSAVNVSVTDVNVLKLLVGKKLELDTFIEKIVSICGVEGCDWITLSHLNTILHRIDPSVSISHKTYVYELLVGKDYDLNLFNDDTDRIFPNLTPLIFSFELPIVNSNSSMVPNKQTPYVIQVEQQYNVQVMFRTQPKLYATLVMIKGSEWEIQQLKQATRALMECICEDLTNEIPIQMSMEITPHYHMLVTGINHANLQSIIRNTRTQIMFPDAHDPNIPNLKKSNVTISGNIHNVYIARQQLMGSLPLVLMFDLPEDSGYLLEPERLANIQSSLDVAINIRPKAKQNTMACIIKGIERNATKIYEARHRILDIREPCIVADIPTSYFIPHYEGTSEVAPLINVQPASPLLSSQTWQPFIQQTPLVDMMHQPQFTYNGMMQNSSGTSGYSSLGQFPASLAALARSHESSIYSPVPGTSPIASPVSSPRSDASPIYQTRTPNESPISELSSILSDASNNSGGHYHNNQNDERVSTTTPDYERKRIAGIRAMHSQPVGGYRTPTNAWSGYGISYTTPGGLQFSEQETNIWKTSNIKQDGSMSATSTLNTSNILESTPVSVVNRITNSMFSDLPTMLTSLGLEKYIATFTSNEIDLITFPSLTESDLTELGVKAFGARRKIMLIISEMNKRSSPFSPAPGAERSSSVK